MNSADISAPVTAAKASPAAPAVTAAPAANDADSASVDFATLLGIGTDVAAASDTDAGTTIKPEIKADKADAGDDGKAQAAAAAPADSNLPDWLQAMRDSLSLIGAMFAPPPTTTADAKLSKPAAPAAPNQASAPPAAAKASAAAVSTKADSSAAITALTADMQADPALPTETTAPTADRRFDALLATMGEHETATLPLATGGNLASGTLLAMPTAATTTAPAAVPPMTVPPDHPQFTHDLGERIVWITDAGLSSAKIELHPLDLGSISVHVKMSGDTAQVAFAADNPATRALLQDSLPQLRELMSVQGLQLLRAQVDQKVAATRSADTGFSQSGEREGGDSEGRMPLRRVTRLKLVDAYV